MFNYIISDKNCDVQNRNTGDLLIEWKGRTGTNTWLGVMSYGPSAAKSLLHEWEPNQTHINKHFIIWSLTLQNFNLNRTQ